MRFTYDLLNATNARLAAVSRLALQYLDGDERVQMYVVWPFRLAPTIFRQICCRNGGDEDWMVLTTKEPEILPAWLQAMSASDLDVYWTVS